METVSKFKSIYLWLFVIGLISLFIPASQIFFVTTAILIVATVYIMVKAPRDIVRKRGAILLLIGAGFTIISFILSRIVYVDPELIQQLADKTKEVDSQKLVEYMIRSIPALLAMFVGWIIRIIGVVMSFKEYRQLKKEED